jgi:ERCC4-type nuclease
VDYYRIVDSREHEKRRMIMLERGWVQQVLHSGDYAWLSKDQLKFGLTLKNVDDFLGSNGYRSELFAKQLDELLDAYDVAIFMREGSINYDTATGIVLNTKGDHNIKDIRNWLHRWQVKGLIIDQTYSLEETANRICELYALWQKPYSLSARSRKWADERVLALCSGLRGKAGQDALSNHSIAELCMMGTRQLEELPGIGTKRALNLFNHLHRKPGNNNAVPE